MLEYERDVSIDDAFQGMYYTSMRKVGGVNRCDSSKLADLPEFCKTIFIGCIRICHEFCDDKNARSYQKVLYRQ